jgi:oligopeptide/dipeptide ABC transporter ATP-binding protein
VLLQKIAEVKAVDGVSFDLLKGETLGVVGESGCGKSTMGRGIVNILRAMNYGVEISGQILYQDNGQTIDLVQLSRSEMRPYRSAIQMIFQDPYSSLNPRLTVRQIIEEPLRIHTRYSAAERRDQVVELLEKVGLSQDHANRYPHEFSGGQRQRIGIARSLSTRPRIVIADEPVSALDVSIQAQVINLMQELQEEFDLSYIFIAHDLSVVRHISDRIAVMYMGNIVEIGPAEKVYRQPLHPYSRALLSAVPRPDPKATHEDRIPLTGDVPSPIRKPSGCAFHTRCPVVEPSCSEEVPSLDVKEDRAVACPWV